MDNLKKLFLNSNIWNIKHQITTINFYIITIIF